MKSVILSNVDDLVSDLLYYDRKEDDFLPRGAIEKAIKDGDITVEEILNKFSECLKSGIDS